ncbi:hypothetical protein GCM10018791_05570 [Streptomyces zaomyceticus]|nr:hypothetical protein GCM10018791_05570 [Streptomyces zaomyceticus]
MVEQQHHRAVEIRVRQRGGGDEQPSCERGHLGHATHDPASSAFAGVVGGTGGFDGGKSPTIADQIGDRGGEEGAKGRPGGGSGR